MVSAAHFNLATTQFNLPGLVLSNAQAKITGYVADRFGNFNILKGTTISFQTDAGAIDTSGTTDSTGITTPSVVFRTQFPMPKPVAIVPWEVDLINHLNRTYSLNTDATTTLNGANLFTDLTINVLDTSSFLSSGWIKIDTEVISYTGTTGTSFTGCTRGLFGTTAVNHSSATVVTEFQSLNIPADGSVGHPRNGRVTVLASVPGEETFNDLNGNGLYDPGEPIIDIGEPLADHNEDGCWNKGDGTEICPHGAPAPVAGDPFELYTDTNGNGTWDIPNGLWDGPDCTVAGCQKSKLIWDNMILAFTGNAFYCSITPLSIGGMPYGSSKSFSFIVGDININALVPLTTIKATTSGGGTLVGETGLVIADGVPIGPAEISFTLLAPDPCATPPCKVVSNAITVTVAPPAPVGGCSQTVTGFYF